jgi:hypothetical protein
MGSVGIGRPGLVEDLQVALGFLGADVGEDQGQQVLGAVGEQLRPEL